jgi:hypothetical protein
MNCKYCERFCKNENSRVQHEIRCKNNGDKITVISNFINYKAKSLGISIEVSKETRDKISKSSKGRKYSVDDRQKMSLAMQKVVLQNPNSYNSANVNGRVKKINYNGILLDGSWEVLVATWFDNNNIKWIKNVNGFQYNWELNIKTYYPDFYLIDFDLYVEVKGYERPKDIEKWKVVDNLLIVKHKDILEIKNNTYNIKINRLIVP